MMSFRKVNATMNVGSFVPEIQTLVVNIPFQSESLRNYSCMAIDPETERILHQDTVSTICAIIF